MSGRSSKMKKDTEVTLNILSGENIFKDYYSM